MVTPSLRPRSQADRELDRRARTLHCCLPLIAATKRRLQNPPTGAERIERVQVPSMKQRNYAPWGSFEQELTRTL
jgi:hypothetical protein